MYELIKKKQQPRDDALLYFVFCQEFHALLGDLVVIMKMKYKAVLQVSDGKKTNRRIPPSSQPASVWKISVD